MKTVVSSQYVSNRLCRSFALFIALLITSTAFTQLPKPKPNTYVNDYTNSLSRYQVEELNQRLRKLESETTIQVAMVLIQKLPPEVEIEDYARQIGNSWKVGNHRNGIVFIAALDNRRFRLEIAEKLEGDIPDIVAGQMLEEMKPWMKKGDYSSALHVLINSLNARMGFNGSDQVVHPNIISADPYRFAQPTTSETAFEKEKKKYEVVWNYLFWLLVAGALVFVIWAARYKKKYWEMYTVDGVYRGIGSPYFPVDNSTSTVGSGGGYGGFGGGGGGGFSGGGASGSW